MKTVFFSPIKTPDVSYTCKHRTHVRQVIFGVSFVFGGELTDDFVPFLNHELSLGHSVRA